MDNGFFDKPESNCSNDDYSGDSADIIKPEQIEDKFCVDDLESLQDANIDNELLENCLINGHFDQEVFKMERIARHAKQYGYIKFTEKVMKQKKKKLLKQTN